MNLQHILLYSLLTDSGSSLLSVLKFLVLRYDAGTCDELKGVVVVHYFYVTSWRKPLSVPAVYNVPGWKHDLLHPNASNHTRSHSWNAQCLSEPAPTYISSSSKPSRDKARLPRTKLPTLSYINCMVEYMWQRCACAEKFHSIHTF
jgi:hypothetical protein